MSEAKDGPATAKVRSYLGKRLRVVLSDKRVIVGQFDYIDKEKNIILLHSTEAKNLETKDSKPVGQVMVPGNHIVSVEIEKSATKE
mgnify:CR=1 FL=1